MIRYDSHQWLSHLFDVRGSMVREILGRTSLCAAWALLVEYAFYTVPGFAQDFSIPETAHALVGGALGLLLVFRTNASYDRFWEGRKLWGAIVNDSRNLARLVKIYWPENVAERDRLLQWIAIWPFAAMAHLRGQRAYATEKFPVPQLAEDKLLRQRHAPFAVATEMSRLVEQGRQQGVVTDLQQTLLEQHLRQLMDSLGGCERIRSTPLPFAYAVHLRRALILYCFTLPLALAQKFGWGSAVAVVLIAYVLFGIEEIGVEIEDPFGEDDNDLPLDTICENIVTVVLEPARQPSPAN